MAPDRLLLRRAPITNLIDVTGVQPYAPNIAPRALRYLTDRGLGSFAPIQETLARPGWLAEVRDVRGLASLYQVCSIST